MENSTDKEKYEIVLKTKNTNRTFIVNKEEFDKIDKILLNIQPDWLINECKLNNFSIDKRLALREDILDRYDNIEYWEPDIIDNPDLD